jgi:O-glycosyl hydrolase
LNATASVPGTFTYSPAAGAVPKAGAQTLSVAFTPTDTSKYTSASASVTLTVTQATPAVTWTAPAGITYGTALSATQLDATSSVAGTFVYSPAAGQVLAAGNQSLSVTFTPTDATDYTTAAASVTLAVSKVTPAITWTAPAGITYGTALSATQLDATSNVPGTFAYSPAAGQIPVAGSQNLSVTFTPTDATDYNTPAAQTVQLTVNMAAFNVTCANVGMTFGSSVPGLPVVVTGEVAGDGITASCSTTATSSSPVGSYPITGTLNDPNSKLANYTVTITPATLTVSKATPVITWATPAAVTVGATLGSTQLDATATNGVGTSVLGTFAYTPPSGTVLNTAETLQLSTTFTPTDATDYTTATGTVSLSVNNPLVSVDFGAQDQLIRGFGGSTAWLGTMPQAVATGLFDPVNGLGMSILRVRIDPTGSAYGGGASGDPYETGEWDYEAANGLLAVTANPKAIVFATPWTPPAVWKLNGSATYTDPGSSTEYNEAFASTCSPAAHYCGGYLDPSHYADYAAYLEDFVSFFNTTNGFNLYAISMQNEPEENVTYESCIWSPLQMDTWVAGNASIITADPTYPTKLIMPEADSFQPAQALTALEDPNAENLISIIGGHIYGVSPAPYTIPAGDSPKEIWMTEFGPLSTATPTYAQSLTYAESVHNSMVTGQYNAYVWWGIFGTPTSAGTWGLVNTSGNPTVMGYALGQYSKFIQPGYYRYNATARPSGSVFVSAYAGTQGTAQHYVIVAINASTAAVSQPFTIANGTVTSMTPYQTTSSGGLMPQSEITITDDAFTYTLPAQSITTFVQ